MSQLRQAHHLPTASRSRIIAVLSSLFALTGTVVAILLQQSLANVHPARAEILQLEREFHACMAKWTPDMGTRSPCPKIQDRTNISLLHLFDVYNADMSKVASVIGQPTAIFENGKYPGTYYCEHPRYWTVMCLGCAMLLPRNPQYDSIMKLSMLGWDCVQVDLDVLN